ncbi:MAG: NAD kinase [Alphaproteobacteria bacterium MarineAlpha5_Bin9]|nr:MAG: NAD kinase [Alphaproteobacteria bacterium MarineAlpha5_Bin9]|tara:strand:- start:23396 stop:24154 length:759 start_codon:yes stop_codon:yes gene_type:complete
MKFHFTAANIKEAQEAKEKYINKYNQTIVSEADIIIAIGGDGFLLKTIHDFKDLKKSFYGINYGSIGFLMNKDEDKDLHNIMNKSQKIKIKPLLMQGIDVNKNKFQSIAFNEVSLMRETHQAAKLKILINEIIRLEELVCDGILVSTPAGSTAYNFSAHGSIIPLDSKLLALTPISAFRPRRWRGALLSENTKIKIISNNIEKRPVSVTADHNEFRNIIEVEIQTSKNFTVELLFDNNHSIEEKILNEQFYS